MFTRNIPLVDLMELCRNLRHQLGAGITILQVMTKQGQRGRASIRALAGRVADRIRQGRGLAEAFESEGGALPKLFVAMVKLGEESGHLAEIFGELERYYQLEAKLRSQFRRQSLGPIAQFAFAVAVIAAVIFILGVINPAEPLVTVFGFGGAAGALAFVGIVAAGLAAGWALYLIARQQSGLLLKLPVLGPCMHAIAMSRFTLALKLTLDSGLPITRALVLSLEATGAGSYSAASDVILNALRKGRPLHDALAASKLFRDDFLEMIVSSEAVGSVPEMMGQLAVQYQEEAGRQMALVGKVAAGIVWCAVGGFLILAIFRFAGVYLGALRM